MDDLWSRIQQQNAEAETHSAPANWRHQHAAPQQVIETEIKVRTLGGRGGGGGGGARLRQGGGAGAYAAPSEAHLAAQERALERELEHERHLHHQPPRGRPTGSAGSRPGAPPSVAASSVAPLGGGRRGGEQKENSTRGKISLLPPRTGASCAPSVAGSVTPSERLRRPVHFTHGMLDKAPSIADGRRGQMDEFLRPDVGIRDQMRRAGVAPKDHMRDNRKMLQQMAVQRQVQQQVQQHEEQQREQLRQHLKERSLAKAQEKLATDPALYEYAPKRGASAGRRSVHPPPQGSDDVVPQAKPRPHEPGHVPAYLRQRKAQWAAAEREETARAAAAAECPPGLRLVGPEEKSRILQKLAEERAKAATELRALPFVVKTQATQREKDRLEARLEEIAGAEEAYLKERVFVPADM